MRNAAAPSFLLERDELVAHISGQLEAPEARPFLLHGPPGVGKTALAMAILSAWKRSGRPAQFVRWSVLDEQSWRETLSRLPRRSSHPTLLVVDDAGGIPPSLIQDIDGVRLLLVARRQLPYASLRSVEVPALSLDAARELFTRRTHAALLDGAPAGALDALVSALDGIPRAIELAASRAHLTGIGPLLEYMSEDLGVLSQKIADRSTRHRSIRRNMQEVWTSLNAEEQALLQICSVFNGGFTLRELTIATGLPLPAVLAGLDGLIASSALLSRAGAPVQFEVLGMMRTFITQHTAPNHHALAEARGRVVDFVDARATEVMQGILSAQVSPPRDISPRLFIQAARSALEQQTGEPEAALIASRCLLAAAWLGPSVEAWGEIIDALDVLSGAPEFSHLSPPARALHHAFRAFSAWGSEAPRAPLDPPHGAGPMIAWAQLLMSWSNQPIEQRCPSAGIPQELSQLLELEALRSSTSASAPREETISALTLLARTWPRAASPTLGCINRGLQAEIYIKLGVPGRALPLVNSSDDFEQHPALELWWTRLFVRAATPHKKWDEIGAALTSAHTSLEPNRSSRAAMMLELEHARVELARGDHGACLPRAADVLARIAPGTDPLFLHAFTLVFLSELLAAYEIQNIEPAWIHARLNALGYPVEFASWWGKQRAALADARVDTTRFDALRFIANSIYDHGIAPGTAPAPLRAHHQLWTTSPDQTVWRELERWRASHDLIISSILRATDVLLTHPEHRDVALALSTPSNAQEAVFDMKNHRVKLGQAEWLDFSKRPKMRRLLEALLAGRARGEQVTSEQLIDHIWQDETVRYDSALSRLYNLLSTTRKLGLEPLLSKSDQGYGFSSEWSVRVI